MLPNPLLDVNAATQSERGVLGIAVAKHSNTNGRHTYVLLYYTESATKDGEILLKKGSVGKSFVSIRINKYIKTLTWYLGLYLTKDGLEGTALVEVSFTMITLHTYYYNDLSLNFGISIG